MKRINVRNKIATYNTRDGVIVCGNKGYTITFTFDEEWNECTTKTARFIWNGRYYDQEFTGDECSVPVINDATNVTVGVYAGDLKTTTPANIPCLISILCGNPKIIEENIKEYRDIAQQAAATAQQAAEEAVRAAGVVVNPTIDVEEIEGGHRITIHDADGDESFDVMGGNVTIDKVDPSMVFFEETVYTGYAVGNIGLENGKAILANKGDSLLQVMKNIYSKTTNPTTKQPSVTLTFKQAGTYEVGTTVKPSYSVTFNKGSYSFDDDTGVTLTGWEVTDNAGSTPKTETSGSFASFTVTGETNYKITAKATYKDGIIPHDNMGGDYPAGQIKAGTAKTTSNAVTGYRNTFYGTLTHKNQLNSDIIRGELSKSGMALSNGSNFTIEIPEGAVRVVIAYPATLRNLTSVKDVNGLNAQISDSFKCVTIKVEGADGYKGIDYKVYTLDYANANDTANEYTVTI